VPKQRRARFVALVALLAHRRPDVDASAIAAGRVLVDGRTLTNPAARVRFDASLRVVTERRLRGEIKLSNALDALDLTFDGCVAIDVGANVGGFTLALLSRGVRRVYAVDAGVGMLLGRLRHDPRVVNLEGHNLGVVDRSLVAERIDVITMDVSYLAVADAVPQLERLDLADDAQFVALVKPTFELRRGTLAATDGDLQEAVARATCAVDSSGWEVVAAHHLRDAARRGAREVFIHARRRS
jgi:23S rRNA (cytidine1920-2'-O)/16S rRNA (cytidine1409-2'-O)-methyltransferase